MGQLAVTDDEQKEWDLKLRKLDAEIELTRETVNKSIAETRKIQSEHRYYPLVVGSGATLAIVALTKLFL